MSLSVSDVRERLAETAARRRSAALERESVSDEIRELLRDAVAVGIPVSEVARTLDMDRSTLYRVYAA